jgi:ribose-phosphate pyrophosphokinase
MLIDTDNYAASGIEVIWFAGGEPHVKATYEQDFPHAHIYAKIRSAADLLALAAVCSSLECRGIKRHIFMPYLPGARQDRVQLGGALTAEVYARMIASMATTLTAVDVHSQDAVSIYHENMDGFRLLDHVPLVKAASTVYYDVVLAPDKGAVARASAVAGEFPNASVLFCEKIRDPQTGHITIRVPDDDLLFNAERILIPDDICDGGATFMLAGRQIIEMNPAAQLDLWVTHGIFSKGLELLDMFDNVMTTDSFVRPDTLEVPEGMTFTTVHLVNYYLESLTP